VAMGYLYFGISNPRVIRGKAKKNPDIKKEKETAEEKDLVSAG